MKTLTLVVFLISSTPVIFSDLFSNITDGRYHQQEIPFRENSCFGNKPILREYDFIVIGAGAGGSVVANRLTEHPNWTVLILEAGRDESLYTDIPALAGTGILFKTDYNWGYTAEPSKNGCLSEKNNRCPWPKGKGLGGSSIINSMFYSRGKMEDYNTISALGNPGWAYTDVLPYFLKSENNSIPEYQNSPFHSHKGKVHVERVRYHSPLVDMFVEAGGELGLQKNIDYTVNPENGVSRIQSTTLNGRRVSACKAYIRPVRNRQNLHVAIFSRVTKIIIDPQTKKATGVEFTKKGKNRIVYATKEVILSAGPINSPQLLMLSGVGPKDHLKNIGIPVIQDLPVGQNLLDHYGTKYGALEFTINQTNPAINERTVFDPDLLQEWYIYGRGPLTVPIKDGIGYIRSPSGKEIELLFAPLGKNPNTFFMSTLLLQPDARGSVTLQSKDPWQPPIMSYNYYDSKSDLDDNIYGLKFLVRLVEETQAFKSVAARLNPVPYPNCDHLLFKSDDYWACFSKYTTSSSLHQCSTCRMGDVVNSNLQVLGIKRLRVIDSSIFPHIPRAHLYAPTLMVGEKGADMVRKYWS